MQGHETEPDENYCPRSSDGIHTIGNEESCDDCGWEETSD